MLHIEKITPAKPVVQPVKLATLKPKAIFHFASDPLEAVLQAEGPGLYMVVDDPDRAKAGRVVVVCFNDGKTLLRDDVHLVHEVQGVKLTIPVE